VSTELALVMPLLLMTVLFVVQAGLWMHATHIAQAAATRAAATAASYQGSAHDGQQAATDTLTALGSTVLTRPSVTVTRTATQVRVEVQGAAATVVPGTRWKTRAVVVRQVERFIPATDPGQG
jgi:Flp pilus assembly protein TadG